MEAFLGNEIMIMMGCTAYMGKAYATGAIEPRQNGVKAAESGSCDLEGETDAATAAI